MREGYRNVIKNYTGLPDDEIDYAVGLGEEVLYKRNSTLYQDEETTDYIAFIEIGIAAMYNEEIGIRKGVMEFYHEGNYIADMYSYLTENKRLFNFYFLEDSTVLKLSRERIKELRNGSVEWERMSRMISEKAYISQIQYTYEYKFLSLKERYLKLMDEHFDIIQRVPQYLIASYLDTTPETLSRIRKKLQQG